MNQKAPPADLLEGPLQNTTILFSLLTTVLARAFYILASSPTKGDRKPDKPLTREKEKPKIIGMKPFFPIATAAAIALTISFCTMVSVQAQSDSEETQPGKNSAAQLGITPEQKSQLEELARRLKTAAETIRDSNANEQDKLTQLTKLRDQAKKAMLTILTPDQVAKMNQANAQRH